MPVYADPQYLQVNAARFLYQLFITGTMFLYFFFWPFTTGYMAVILINIDMIKKIHPHETMIALQGIPVHRVIFIQIKSNHIFKAQTFFPVQPDELRVQGFGGSAGSQPQNTGFALRLFFLNEGGNFPGCEPRPSLKSGNICGYLLK